MRKFRIRTTPGESKNIQVKLEQDFDVLEILSLKFTQSEIYTRMCADYGVVVGRVSSNHGFGIPNARVSVFIPLSEEDEDDPVISTLYPYKSVADRNEDGYRYNLLPYAQQHSGHAPTGTFPEKSDVLYRQEVLEIYEKYYKYTVKTNNAGDFMIWGVPVGTHTVHVDVDISDIGCFSVRPYDLMEQGYANIGQFKNSYEYASNVDIDMLPQILKFDKAIEVIPFWGNADLCEVGITRTDFDFSELGVSLKPTSLFIGSMISDAGGHATSKWGKPKKRQGFKCNLATYEGGVEAIRFTGRKYNDKDGNYYPELEYVELSAIDVDGSWMVSLPMNMEHIITNEFGEEEFTNDPNMGVATSGNYRFRIGYDYNDGKTEIGDYLVPNIREFTGRRDGMLDESNKDTQLSYVFSDDFDDYFRLRDANGSIIHQNDQIRDLILGKGADGIPQDYFYKFTYNKTFSVSSFHGSHFEGGHRDSFIGIKENLPNPDHDCQGTANKFPVNFGFKNRVSFSLILASVLLFFKFIITVIILKINEIVGGAFYAVGEAINFSPLKGLSQRLRHVALKWQSAGQKKLPLSIYPICEECGTDQIEKATNDLDPAELLQCPVASGTTTIVSYNSPVDRHQIWFDQSAFQSLQPDSGACPNAQSITFNQLNTLHTASVIQNIPDSGELSRYAISLFTLSGSPDSAASSYIAPGFEIVVDTNFSPDMTLIAFPDRASLVEFISEADPSFVDNGAFSIQTKLNFQIFDLDGKKPPVVVVPEYQIEAGCDRYDKFYNEDLLHPKRSYLWAVNDNNYGSPQVSIDLQNKISAEQQLQSTIYPGGVFPQDVLSFSSYADDVRTLTIYGLDQNATYNVELMGSRRMPVGSLERTKYTIGAQSISTLTSMNLTQSALFNNIQPTGDVIIVDIENDFVGDGYNYINGFKITQVGGPAVWVNLYPGIGTLPPAQWNNWEIGLGVQTDEEVFNLKNTAGADTTLHAKLSYSLNMGNNNLVSPLQQLYWEPYLLNNPAVPQVQPAPSPYDVHDYQIIAAVAASNNGRELPGSVSWSKIGYKTYVKETKTGFTEIRNGVITLVPVIRGTSKNIKVIKEWYNRNKVALSFCGGIVNHTFIDNWLTGTLYAFKFKFRKGADGFFDALFNGRSFQYPRRLVYYNGKHDRFYYRSTPFDTKSKTFIGQMASFFGKFHREILRPTTCYDLGPRDEFIGEICTDKRIDPNCAVIRDISTTSYQNIEEIIEYAINYRMDISNAKINVNDFFDRDMGGVKVFDGDIIQLESINCEAGIEEFDLESAKYFMYNGELLDPEDSATSDFFKDDPSQVAPGQKRNYGPTPIDLKMDPNGRAIRLCLNHPDFLGSTSQNIPFYLWDKKGTGFGFSKNSDDQEFKKDQIVVDRLQRIQSFDLNYNYIISGSTLPTNISPTNGRTLLLVTSGTTNTPLTGLSYVGNGSTWVGPTPYVRKTNYLFANGTEEYMLYPMTKKHDWVDFDINGPDSLDRFDFLSLVANDRFLPQYVNAPEGSLFMQVTQGTIQSPQQGRVWVKAGGSWNPGSGQPGKLYRRNEDDIFISATEHNYSGNLQVLSTPFQFYFGLRPGKTAYDKFIKAFGFKGAFKKR